MHNVDIAVVGGGMVGLALAALLRDSELSVAVINRSRNARELESITEPRVSALNLASQQMLVAVGAWPLIAASPGDRTRLPPPPVPVGAPPAEPDAR